MPILSVTRIIRIPKGVTVKGKKIFVNVDSAYPKKASHFLFLNLSEKYPETIFKVEDVVSASPSITPINAPPAPIDSRKCGKTFVIISDETSVKKLTNPSKTTFRLIFLFVKASYILIPFKGFCKFSEFR